MIKIAVDAMGGDQGPKVLIEGALAAIKEYDILTVLVGKPDLVKSELDRHYASFYFCNELAEPEVVAADEVIEMHESPIDVLKRKKNSSIAVAIRLLKDCEVDGVVSAGNTGAVLVSARKWLGNLDGIRRPAIATLFPNRKDFTVVIDAGANVDCKPQDFVEFAVMGQVYAEYILNKPRPTVGLLSIGEERTKGNLLTLEAYKLLVGAPVNFVGNVEGRDVFNGSVDVVVCDGFVGNVILKTSEGLAEMILGSIKKEFKKNAIDDKSVIKRLKKRLDHSEYGGAPLLGTKGTCIIAHGSSNKYAVQNAIRVAAESVTQKVNEHIESIMNSKVNDKKVKRQEG